LVAAKSRNDIFLTPCGVGAVEKKTIPQPRCNRTRTGFKRFGREQYAQQFSENDIDFKILSAFASRCPISRTN